MDERQIRRDVAGAERAHGRLLGLLDERLGGDLDPLAPSRLPGWTLGHVLTHVARNADGIVRAIDGANRGEAVARYAGGTAQRDADIQAGHARTPDVLVADVRAASERLEAVWSGDVAWDGHSIERQGAKEPVSNLPFLRWREVEVHTVDLGLGLEVADWPDDYVRLDLRQQTMRWDARRPMGLTGLPAAVLALDPRTRLAWLLGRVDVADVPPPSPF